MARKYYKGQFIPKNPRKYEGDPTQIIYRSRWELRVMHAFDQNDAIVKWGSETKVIPYFWSVDGKNHRYFTDFVIAARAADGSIKKAIVEVKPYSQTIPPVKTKRKKESTWLEESATWSKNQAKWAAAREYAKKYGYSFLLLTEHDIFPGKAY